MTQGELSVIGSAPRIFSRQELRSRGITSLDRIFAMGSYRSSPLLRKAIHTLKYKRVPALTDCLSRVLIDVLQRDFVLSPEALFCPVPLHVLRRFSRGFNQAELIAQHMEEVTAIPMRPLLRRVRPTGHQTWRGRSSRLQAMNGAFRVRRGSMIPRHVYLVDDVFTTGATLAECAKTLRMFGAECVEAIVLAYD